MCQVRTLPSTRSPKFIRTAGDTDVLIPGSRTSLGNGIAVEAHVVARSPGRATGLTEGLPKVTATATIAVILQWRPAVVGVPRSETVPQLCSNRVHRCGCPAPAGTMTE
jgi:hypothetical protein